MGIFNTLKKFLKTEVKFDLDGKETTTDLATKLKVTEFLNRYAMLFSANYGLEIPTPSIDPCADDSIDLHWLIEDRKELLINIPKVGNYARFYGDNGIILKDNHHSSIKGALDIRDNNSQWLFLWLIS